MLQSIQALTITIIFSTFTFADVFITELADPNNNASARFVELHNNGSDIDLSNYKIRRWTNGNDYYTGSSEITLSGTLGAGGFFIICKSDAEFSSVYSATCDLQLSSGVGDSNGDDQIELVDLNGNTVDIFGVPGEDGTGTGHEFEDGRAERAYGVCGGAGTWDVADWNIDNDSGGGDGTQNAPEDFDPGAWIGSGFDCGGGSTACDDEAACNTGADDACEYPDTGYDCDGNCVGEVDCAGVCGGDAVEDCSGLCDGDAAVDDCGECGGSNACFISVTFNVNMALENISDDGVRLYGIDGDWSTGISMTDDGSGTFSTTVDFASGSFHLYKFKNGGSWENVDELECAWFDDPDGDGFGYWDRYLNLDGVSENLDLGSVCFSGCEDCATEVSGCTDPLADNYNPDANVDDGTCEYSFEDPENLFFSEAAEGSSNNKYLEIYNGTDGDVDLSSYSLSSCSNGCDETDVWDYSNTVTFDAGIMLASGDVYVVCHGSADDFIQAECDQHHTYLSNGDDVYALTQVGSGAILDIIGTTGDDPGSGWEVAGVSNATKDHTLVRDASVTSGNGGNWEESAGDADDSEWIVLDQNTWSFLGSHPHDFSITCDDDTACNYGEESDCYYAEAGYDCDGNAFINITFNVNMADQTVDTEGYGLDLYLDEPYGYHDMLDDDGDGVWSVTLTLLANTTYNYKFKNGAQWENNFNDLGCGAGDTYGNRTITSGDSDLNVGPFCFNSCSDCEAACSMGDVNADDSVDILDIVSIVSYIVNQDGSFDIACADANGDGSLDILDIVSLVTDIVGSARINDATYATLIQSDNSLSIKSDGYIGGIQMILHHNETFSIQLSDNAMIADFNTISTETIIVIVSPEDEELFTYEGGFEIVELIVANSSERINVTKLTEFSLSEAYPNPFNPTTSITLSVPEATNVTVQVYNMMGQVVGTLMNGFTDANTYTLTWNASNVSSGMYFVKAEVDGNIKTKKLLLLK